MTKHSTFRRIANIKALFICITRRLAFALLGVFVTPAIVNAEKSSIADITVVSSIKPIQLISTAVMGGAGQSKVLLPPSANPHNYQLRPSQRALLSKADLFVWVGPELELFLVKVLGSSSVNELSLTNALKLGNAEPVEPSLHLHHHEEHDEHSHRGSFDPHIWLNPALTKQIATTIAEQLSAQYPALASQFQLNLEQFIKQLKITESEITQLFSGSKQVAIYTFHEAFTHFSDHYGMKIDGTITKTPESRPGAKHLSELAKEIAQNKKICLVKEPNFKAPYVDSLTRGTEVIVTIADPLATNIDNSATGYFEFITSIAKSFHKCTL